MLRTTREAGDIIKIGDVTIEIVSVVPYSRKVRIHIDAPQDLPVTFKIKEEDDAQ